MPTVVADSRSVLFWPALRWALLFVAAVALNASGRARRCSAEDHPPAPIFDASSMGFHAGQFTDKKNQKVSAGTVEAIDDAKFGKAMKLSFPEGASGGFIMASIPSTAGWDRAAGFSLWIKGDGSSHWGGIELIDKNNFGLRYAYCFPIDSHAWRKIDVAWSDLLPELAGPLIGVKGGYDPSGFGYLAFGKWFFWRDYPAESYTVGPIALASKIETLAIPPIESGLKRVAAKFRAHQPVTIVTMGDSLSDPHHWSNRPTLWSELLVKEIKDRYKSIATLVNPAIGGTTLSQNTILMPRWSPDAPAPDLVTVWFGGNDWDSNVRGPRFAEYLRVAVDRIRRQTHGSADILLMTTLPSRSRWETTRELERAVREVAAEKKTGFLDIAAEFRKAPSADAAAKRQYWGWDNVHLGQKGHEIVAAAVLKALEDNAMAPARDP
ncbi:MAG TPA: GDSL-type esterase/lipase family protein [Pirellulales bacterium]|nr:GDSL-type esterase/lipase family protein [Pirellulales bacterium]